MDLSSERIKTADCRKKSAVFLLTKCLEEIIISISDISIVDILVMDIEGERLKKEDMEQLTDPAYYILLSVLEERHGYAIMQYIESISGGEFTVGPATLYTLVKKLEKSGLIVLLESPGDRRKIYKATEKGRLILRSEVERRSRMVQHGEHAFQLLKERENDGETEE